MYMENGSQYMGTKTKLPKLCKAHVRKLKEKKKLSSHHYTHLKPKQFHRSFTYFSIKYRVLHSVHLFFIFTCSTGNHLMWMMSLGWKAGSVHLKPLWLGQHAHGTRRRHWRRLQKNKKKTSNTVLTCPGWIWCSQITNLNWRLVQHENKAPSVSLPTAW